MKKLGLFVMMVALLLSAMMGVRPAAAQGPDPCTQEQLTEWWIALLGPVERYEQAIAQQSSLPAIATIQALRREYDAIEPPVCALAPAPDLVADMFNLRTDSMVLGMLGDAQAETLMAQAETAFQQVKLQIGDVVVPEPTADPGAGGVTEITSPVDGATDVPQQTNVQGTVNQAALGDNSLWLFVYASDGKLYPQVGDACADASTIRLTPGRDRWTMTAFIGDVNDAGKYFELRLGTMTAENTQAFLAEMPTWCANGYPGFSEADIYEGYLFTEVDFVGFNRQ